MRGEAIVKGRPFLLIVPIVAYLAYCFLFHGFVIDDAYITFRYADNFAHGGAISFNPDDIDKVEGYTSFLWMALSAGAIGAGLDPLVVARTVSVACGVAALVLLFSLSRRVLGNSPLVLLPPLMLAVSSEFAEWTMGGLETSCFLFLLLLSLKLLLCETESGRFPWSSATFAVLAMCRPEGAAFAIAALVFRAVIVFRNDGVSGKFVKDVALALLLFAMIYGPYFLWRYQYYEMLLPNSYYAKKFPGRGAPYIGRFLLYLGPIAAMAIASLFTNNPWRRTTGGTQWVSFFWLLILINFAGVWNISPAMAWDWRLFVHLLPLFYLLALPPLIPIVQSDRRAVRTGAIALLVLLLLWSSHPDLVPRRYRECRIISSGLKRAHIHIGQWLRESFPPDTVVATIDTGAIPYFSRMKTIDVANIPLNNKNVVRGLSRVEDFLDENPKILVLRGDKDGKIAYHAGRKILWDQAMEAGFIMVNRAMYREDYILYVFMNPNR